MFTYKHSENDYNDNVHSNELNQINLEKYKRFISSFNQLDLYTNFTHLDI
jgi:hypothetical protein